MRGGGGGGIERSVGELKYMLIATYVNVSRGIGGRDEGRDR